MSPSHTENREGGKTAADLVRAKLLNALGGVVTYRMLGSDPAKVRNRIGYLRNQGVPIENVRGVGYRLVASQ